MCTASWAPRPDGYTLCFNRDERRTRAPELPAAVRQAAGVAFLAPLDGDAGGTWIAVNQWGVTLSLLNRYQLSPAPDPPQPRSRGLVILDLITTPDLAAVEAGLGHLPLAQHRPFTLVAAQPGQPALVAGWDGTGLMLTHHQPAGLILTSSSVSEPEVALARRALFAGLPQINGDTLEATHRSHLPERGRRSVCMHRPEAETRSYSRIEVTESAIELRHIAGAPCVTRTGQQLSLPRAGRPGDGGTDLWRAGRPALGTNFPR
jgi:hypothetical protein